MLDRTIALKGKVERTLSLQSVLYGFLFLWSGKLLVDYPETPIFINCVNLVFWVVVFLIVLSIAIFSCTFSADYNKESLI